MEALGAGNLYVSRTLMLRRLSNSQAPCALAQACFLSSAA